MFGPAECFIIHVSEFHRLFHHRIKCCVIFPYLNFSICSYLAKLAPSRSLCSPRPSLLQGDLGGIPEQYDVAISTACPQLENIVIDNMETGTLLRLPTSIIN